MENPPPTATEPPHCIIPLHKPKRREYLFFFISGIVVSIPFAVFFESLYPSSSALATSILIIVLAPLIEELAKVFPLFYRHGETERSIVTLGLLLGLGFGIAEFTQYVVLLGVPPLARVPGIVFHASSAAITAYGVAKKKPLRFYLIAVGLHFANNFLAVLSDLTSLLVGWLVLVVTYYLAWIYWHRARKDVMVV
jgi:RsiW-degrading membrane proteinase PrsW (M82 family)